MSTTTLNKINSMKEEGYLMSEILPMLDLESGKSSVKELSLSEIATLPVSAKVRVLQSAKRGLITITK